MAMTLLNVKIPGELKAALDRETDTDNKAQQTDMKPAEFIREALDLWAGFTPAMRSSIRYWNRKTNIPPSVFVELLFIERFERRRAESEARGVNMMFENLAWDENGPILGERLSNMMHKKFTEEEDNKKEERLRDQAQDGIISDEDAEWLKVWDEKRANATEAQKRAEENRKNGKSFSYTAADVKKSGLSDAEYEAKILADMKAKREKAGIK